MTRRAHSGQKPRLRDVAARAGVSIGTASNAFNRPELLSEELRERVLAEARALGYAGPDPAARRLRTGRTGAIGLIFTDRLTFAFGDPASTQFLRGVAGGLEDAGAGLLLIPTSPTRMEGAQVVRDAAVDGFLIYSTPGGDPRVEAALGRGLPTVTVDEPYDAPTPFIGIDDRGAAREAALHLRSLGHERVAIIAFPEYAEGDPNLPFDVTIARNGGYREGLGEAFDDGMVVSVAPNSAATGRAALGELMTRRPAPTAILAMSDALAEGVLQGARELGMEVPRELSVVGFDDSPQAAFTLPPLTTVRQPTEQKGELAAATLLAALDGDGLPRHERTVLPAVLVVRGSTAPPP